MTVKCVVFVLLVLMLIHRTRGGHSLQYYHTAVSSPDHEPLLYVSVGYVDGIQITRYSSDTTRFVPVAPWMQKVEDPDYWEEETRNGREAEETYDLNVKIAMHRFNQTEGFHVFQEMYGCELRDDGSTRGNWRYGYDGKDLMTLDTEHWIYSNLTEQAEVSAQRWNEPERREGEKAKDYLETDCINWLRKYLEYGKKELERRVRPEVKVSGRPSGSAMKLHCQVYGFYPRDVDVNWMKNGMDCIPSNETKQILPNSDGTYQIRASVEVTPEDGASYSCHVNHSSLDEHLIVPWVYSLGTKAPHERSSFWRIIICFGSVSAILIGAVFVWCLYRTPVLGTRLPDANPHGEDKRRNHYLCC